MVELKQSLIDNQSICLGKEAKTWEEAVRLAAEPLIKSGAVEERYADAMIASTIKYGPYYILMPGMAMPHARPEDGVIKDSFSLITLKEPVTFSDGKQVSVLITLAATSSEIHGSVAIPQIVAVFELEGIINRLINAKTIDEVLACIDEGNKTKSLID